MKIAVLRETFPGEQRVALTPASVRQLKKLQADVVVESQAGVAAGFLDPQYEEAGATLAADRQTAVGDAQIILQVRAAGAAGDQADSDLELFRPGQIVAAQCDPLGQPEAIQKYADEKLTLFSLELIPRITRAQSMDVLSSMATIAGYRAVIVAAGYLPKLFPLLMTAAGTLKPAKVLVIGAGVAGLQAIATARRLGAVVRGYDVRPVVREQVESLGASFVELNLDTGDAEDQGGYAKALTPEQTERQRQQLADIIADCDVCISTAAIPGRPSPLLITEDAVERMAAGSVIVDLAAERGGNCALTQAGEVCVERGVTICGPTNLPSEAPNHASQMLGRNLENFLKLLVQDGKVDIDLKDEILRDTLATKDGQVQHERLREILGLGPLTLPAASPPADHLAGGDDAAEA